jgi:LysM repeat protein
MALNQNTCPVCGKAGISDFRKEAVVCPQCNSDLKMFMLLNRLGSDSPKPKGYIMFIVIAAILLITGGAIAKYLEVEKKASQQSTTLQLYKDSLKTLVMKQPVLASPVPNKVKQDTIGHSYFVYTVKKGDFTMRIARIFYNDWRKYKEIEQDNNLVEPYHLHKGDVLKIRINQ